MSTPQVNTRPSTCLVKARPMTPVRRHGVRWSVTGLVLTALVVPFAPLLVWSSARSWRFPALWPQALGARSWQVVADPGSQVLTGLATSTGIAACVAVLAGLVGLAAGRALGLHAFPGKRIVQLAMLAPLIVPAIAVTPGIQVAFTRYRLADTVPGVVLAHLIPAASYATLVLAAGYARYDVAFEQQARVLGTPPLRVLLHVTLPLLRPALTTAMLVAFLISWDDYLLTLLVGGGAVTTLPLLLFSAIGSTDTAVASALALVVALPPLVLIGITARSLTPGRPAPTGGGLR
jgi:putative spermidine/putrescine transport system permease protein